MDGRMRSFRLWIPPESLESRREYAKASARWNGAMIAAYSVSMFLLGIWALANLREATWWAFLAHFLACGLGLCSGIAIHRWGRQP
jgi:hypothetical protein